MINWKETPPFNCEMQSFVHLLTIENNSGGEIHRHLWAAYGAENVMSFRNVQ